MTRFKRWLCGLLLLAFSLLIVRWGWIVTASKPGWEGHLQGWVSIACASIGIERRPLREQDPPQQARYWLRQVERVNSSDDPFLAVGAAWMLDAPQYDFRRHYLRKMDGIDFPGIPKIWDVKFDEATIESMEDEFETLCRDQCLQQIKHAVELDPSIVEWWRARALLSVCLKNASIDLKPRDDAWLEMLDEGALHDPENALYDYLAAMLLWADSATYVWAGDKTELTIKNPVRFEAGNRRLKTGLAKPELRFGWAGYAATEVFLDSTSTPPANKYELISSREIQNRSTGILLRMQRWQAVFLDVAKKNGEIETAVSILRNSYKISSQVTKFAHYASPFYLARTLRLWTLANSRELGKAHPGILTERDSQWLNIELDESRLESILIAKASEKLRPRPVAAPARYFDMLFLMVTFQMLFLITLGTGSLAGLLSCIFGRLESRDFVDIGWIRHAVAWVVGFAVSVLIFGVCTSWISPHAGQSSSVSSEARGLLRQFISSWSLVWLQWQAFLGPLAAVVMATGLLSVWNFVRQGRHFQRADRRDQTSQKMGRMGSVCLIVMQSCLAVSLLCFTICLCLVPAGSGQREQFNEAQYQRLIDPYRAFKDMDREIAQIQLDETAMESVRAEVARRVRLDNEP